METTKEHFKTGSEEGRKEVTFILCKHFYIPLKQTKRENEKMKTKRKENKKQVNTNCMYCIVLYLCLVSAKNLNEIEIKTKKKTSLKCLIHFKVRFSAKGLKLRQRSV